MCRTASAVKRPASITESIGITVMNAGCTLIKGGGHLDFRFFGFGHFLGWFFDFCTETAPTFFYPQNGLCGEVPFNFISPVWGCAVKVTFLTYRVSAYYSRSGGSSNKYGIAGLHVTSRRPCRWWSITKVFLSSWILTLISCENFQKNSIVLTPNLAFLSRGRKPRIFLWFISLFCL